MSTIIKKILPFLGCLLVLAPTFVMAEEKMLNADEVKKLFIGKTCDGYNPIKDKNYKLFTKNETKVLHQTAKGTKERDWEVTDSSEHCVHFKSRRCGTIHDMGNGVYHKMNNGKHINTLKNFVEGNKL